MFIDEFGLVNLLNYPSESSVHLLIIDAPRGGHWFFGFYVRKILMKNHCFLRGLKIIVNTLNHNNHSCGAGWMWPKYQQVSYKSFVVGN